MSSPTWLSSFSADILMLGSIVPLRACIIRLGSMCIHDFSLSRFSLSYKYALSLLFPYRFTQTLWTPHFGSDPQTRLPVSTLKCLFWKGFIAKCCHYLVSNVLTWRKRQQRAKQDVKQSTFTTLMFFFVDKREKGDCTATQGLGALIAIAALGFRASLKI